MTNEQAVLDAQAKSIELKDAYMAYLTPLAIGFREHNTPITLSQLVECHRLGNGYFNALEDFVANSGLLGAHMNGQWVTNLAETCHAGLKSFVMHNNFLRSHSTQIQGFEVKPDKHALASMQRMVKEYLEKETSDALFETYVTAELPTQGFTVAAHEDVKNIPAWQLISCMVAGLLLVIGVAVVSLFHPYPSPFQSFAFRGIFSLGLSGAISGVPGFINLKIKMKGWNNYLKLFAGGAIAIFALSFFYNPPAFDAPANSSTTPLAQPSSQATSEK